MFTDIFFGVTSASPSDLGLQTAEHGNLSSTSATASVTHPNVGPVTPIPFPDPVHTPHPTLLHQTEGKNKINCGSGGHSLIPPLAKSSGIARCSGGRANLLTPRTHKPSLKRSSTHTPSVSSRKSPGVFLPSFKEPVVRKEKVIDIVSPRKRKQDHIDLMKTSSDPICIRAANFKSYKYKNKSRHSQLKFSRGKLNKSKSSDRIRRESSSSLGSSSILRMNSSQLQKKDSDSEPAFPTALFDELLWVLEVMSNVECC